MLIQRISFLEQRTCSGNLLGISRNVGDVRRAFDRDLLSKNSAIMARVSIPAALLSLHTHEVQHTSATVPVQGMRQGCKNMWVSPYNRKMVYLHYFQFNRLSTVAIMDLMVSYLAVCSRMLKVLQYSQLRKQDLCSLRELGAELS